MFKGKTILITGGTGSFGNAVLERFINSSVAEIRIFSRDEKKQHDMRLKYNNEKIKFYIGDVRSYSSVYAAMKGVDYVFSAAALKQVPSCEFYPIEAVKTNVFGTENTLRAAIEKNAEKVVVLSTDKAVYPINAMGMSKALMEKVTIANSRSLDAGGPILCNTRYGNVMTSRGSVIPLFINQIVSGQNITITDPEMTRFMMSLDDAVGLVLFAYANAEQGDTFVHKAPATTLINLVEALKEIFEANNDIHIMGTRHGEKKHEVLLSREEMSKCKDLGEFFCVPADSRDLNYTKYFELGDTVLSGRDDYTSENTKQLSVEELVVLLKSLPYVKAQLEKHLGKL